MAKVHTPWHPAQCIPTKLASTISSTVPQAKMPIVLSDDQLSAGDSWEITNSPVESSDHSKPSQCPDLVLKTQQTSGHGQLHCSVCSNVYKFLKPLGCKCKVCVNCADGMFMRSQEQEGQNEEKGDCPLCGQRPTVQPSVYRAQRPVFGNGALKCMTCKGRKDVEDGWWCQDCSWILCSKCAHKSHRDHVTVEFDQEYEAVRFCLSMLQSQTHETATKIKMMTWGKFEQIFKRIESAIDDELERQNKARRIYLTDVFGHCQRSQNTDHSGTESVQKRFSATQQRAKQQFPYVLDEILSMAGLGNKDVIELKTDIVAEKIIDLLKSAVEQLNVEDLKIESEKPSENEESEWAKNDNRPNMYVGDCPENVIVQGDTGPRHY